ncbi:hypothetical protein [Thalassotalea fusca]
MTIYKSILAVTLMSTIVFTASTANANGHSKGIGKPGQAIIYVTSQDLYYDTLLLKPLPYNGTSNFQKLEMAGPTGVQTEFGPTDVGYYGGRWWVDANDNSMMDDEDVYFLCPLLGPGREAP